MEPTYTSGRCRTCSTCVFFSYSASSPCRTSSALPDSARDPPRSRHAALCGARSRAHGSAPRLVPASHRPAAHAAHSGPPTRTAHIISRGGRDPSSTALRLDAAQRLRHVDAAQRLRRCGWTRHRGSASTPAAALGVRVSESLSRAARAGVPAAGHRAVPATARALIQPARIGGLFRKQSFNLCGRYLC
jgi:hypothetical protein